MPTANTPALPISLSNLSSLAAQVSDALHVAPDPETGERKLHPLVAVGAGLVAGLVLARWIRR